MKKILVVLSGGQDSTTCLYAMKTWWPSAEIHAITFDYGQRHSIEIECAVKIAAMAGVASHEIVHLPEGILAGTSPLTDHSIEVEKYDSAETLPGGLEKTFVPMRNALFLTIAANRAYVLGADTMVTGVSEEDFGGYPDCRANFLVAMAGMIRKATEKTIHLEAPLLHLTKEQTVNLAIKLPGCMEALAFSHTCYNGTVPPCGSCHACLLRAKGFEQAGIVDPLTKRSV